VLQGQDEPLTISIDAEGVIFLQETEVTLRDLVPRLIAISESKADTRIFVRGDQAIHYGRIMDVMGTIGSAGFTRMALVAQAPVPVPPQKPRSAAE
jgi:biopolymer transport protein TolR